MNYYTQYTAGIERDVMRLTTGNVAHHRATLAQAARLLTNRLSYNPDRVYLSGQVTGLEYSVAKQNFDRAMVAVSALFPEAEIFNPIHAIEEGTDWVEAMRLCKMVLPTCGTIYMLADWECSQGACIEHNDARQLRMNVVYERPASEKEAQMHNVASAILRETGVTLAELRARRGNQTISDARLMATCIMSLDCDVTSEDIEAFLRRKRGAVRYSLIACKRLYEGDNAFKELYERVRLRLVL
jgi:hypothetical protein